MRMMTHYLLGATILVFILQVLFGAPFNSFFSLTPSLLLQQPWTLVTSMFLHGSVLHIFFNMFGLLMFGPFLESKIGRNNFLLVYFASGILGSIGFAITSGFGNIPVVGASGAIYGILGCLALLQPNLTVLVFFFPMPIYMAAIFWFFIEFSNGIGDLQPGIANFAHVFGLVGGLLAGYYLKKKIIRKGHWLHE
ncbi:MAG: rhomboid family intramembrane serine protease [Candidatus Micrarchaeota archaeon]